MLKSRDGVQSLLWSDGPPLLDAGVRDQSLQIAPRGDFALQLVRLRPSQHRGLDPAEAEIQGIAFHFGERQPQTPGIAVRRQGIQDRSTRVTEAEQLADLVVSFTGGVVACLPHQTILAGLLHFKQMRVPPTGNQGQCRILNRVTRKCRFHENGLEVALQVVYPNEGNVSYNANRLRVGKANEKGADEPWADRYPNGSDRLPITARTCDGFAHDRNNRTQVFPGCEFRDNPAIFGVDVDLR